MAAPSLNSPAGDERQQTLHCGHQVEQAERRAGGRDRVNQFTDPSHKEWTTRQTTRPRQWCSACLERYQGKSAHTSTGQPVEQRNDKPRWRVQWISKLMAPTATAGDKPPVATGSPGRDQRAQAPSQPLACCVAKWFSRICMSTGFTQCASNPAALERSRSSG